MMDGFPVWTVGDAGATPAMEVELGGTTKEQRRAGIGSDGVDGVVVVL